MSGPAKYGVVVYSNNIEQQAEFYKQLFDMMVVHSTNELVSLNKEGFNLVVHTPPIEIPALNFNTIKMFMSVESLEKAKSKAVSLGGGALEGEWSNPIFKVCNIADPEGNHIQLREFL